MDKSPEPTLYPDHHSDRNILRGRHPDLVPNWADAAGEAAREFGRIWLEEERSAILIVPSVVARMERNIIFNTSHEQFPLVEIDLETPVWWDERLFD